MAALKIDDLEHLTNEEIRTFFKSNNEEDYAPFIRETLEKEAIQGEFRLVSLLQRLAMSRFIHNIEK